MFARFPAPALLIAMLFLNPGPNSGLEGAETPGKKPHIVVILADDLGSHDVGWRGSEIRTPNLDALAASGATLDQFYVQPVCSPTRAALMTGRYPFRYGFQTGVVRPWANYGLPLEERMLPLALREAGYETAIVGKWHLGHFQPEYLPTRRGFEHQYGHYNGALDYFTHIRDGGFDWHRNDQVNRDEGYSTELIGREASRLIRERDKNRPLFLYVPFNGVHSPYQVPEEYSKRYPQFKGQRQTYAGMVTAMDDAVGEITAALKTAGILDNTLVLFSSDNGGPAPKRITSNGPLRAGKATVYEGGVRVCAFAAWPGHIPAGSSVQTPIHISDWYPTLLKVAGASEAQPLPVDGRDVLPVLTSGAKSTRTEIVVNAAPNRGAIRVGDWKLVIGGDIADSEEGDTPAPAKPAAKGVTVELFDLAKDPGEKTNLAESQPEQVRKLRETYDRLAAEAVTPKSGPKPKGFQSPAVWGEAGSL
ncbi:arylsulfatase B [Planctomyces sp. SH-PL14]|uniref:arylsulfatase B n=1 Tax=Planctomyces sp. SH-PL14 TaxID=1632864 RepID=UPI00078E64F2|nr:arylsulfatase [Planctomyces sp. SH-PL14]AMV20326.1 Arylsulfatase [Planctomyces sp. SH-PL14]